MKGNKKILVIAALLLLIAASYTTYAIYKESVNANATVTAAAWTVEFKNGQDTITSTTNIVFSGTDCDNTHVAPGKIAPGATCTKTISLDAVGTEVDVAYTATAGTVTATKGGSAVATTGANAFTTSLSPSSGTINIGSSTATELTLTVTWAGLDNDTVDPADVGLEGATITVPVTLVASQVAAGS